jgi:hypothetical protein
MKRAVRVRVKARADIAISYDELGNCQRIARQGS